MNVLFVTEQVRIHEISSYTRNKSFAGSSLLAEKKGLRTDGNDGPMHGVAIKSQSRKDTKFLTQNFFT